MSSALTAAFAADDLDRAVKILEEFVPKIWAYLVRLSEGWRAHPALVQRLVVAHPDTPPGVVADLCGLFGPEPREPREFGYALFTTPDAWRAVPSEWAREVFLPDVLRVVATKVGDAHPHLTFSVPRSSLVAEIARNAATSGMSAVVAALERLVDAQEAVDIMADWLLTFTTTAAWDQVVSLRAQKGSGGVPDAIWPRISPTLAADVVTSLDHAFRLGPAHRPVHADTLAVATAALAGTGSDAVRGRALAILIASGREPAGTLSPGLIAHAFAPLDDGSSIHTLAAAPALFEKLIALPDEILANLVPHVGHALAWGFRHRPGSGVETTRRVGFAAKCVAAEGARAELLLALLEAPVWVDDKVARKRISDALAQVQSRTVCDLLEDAPLALNIQLARSKHTPLVVRQFAAWWAVHAEGFDSSSCDLSDDPDLLAFLFRGLLTTNKTTYSAIKAVVTAAINHVVRTPPLPGAREFDSSPYGMTVDGIASFAPNMNIESEMYEHAVTKVRAALEDGLRRKKLTAAEREDLDQLGIAARRLDDPRLEDVLESVIGKLGPSSATRTERDHYRYTNYRWSEAEPRRGHRVIWAMRILAADRVRSESRPVDVSIATLGASTAVRPMR